MKKRWLGIITALAGVLLAGSAQAEVSTWVGLGANTRMSTGANWSPSRSNSNTNDLLFVTPTSGYNQPGSTYGNFTARSITYSNITVAAHSFNIWRSSSHVRSFTFSSDTGTSTITIDPSVGGNVLITAGTLGSGVQNALHLNNALNVVHDGTNTLTVSARITGTNPIVKSGSGELILGSAQNEYTGSITVSGGTLTLSDNAKLIFDIGGSSTNNSIGGTGTNNLNGDFEFDLTDATTTVGDSWMIVDTNSLTETFGATFSVIDFVDAGNDTWIRGIDGSKSYVFSESTGLLTVEAGSVNAPPTADPQAVSTFTDTAKVITLTGTDLDGPSNLTYTVVTQPVHGTLDVGSIPDVTYTPTNGYNGADSFTFTVFDGLSNSEPATVSIDVLNYVPVADTKFAFTQADTPVAITLSGSDAEGSNLTYNVATQPANGTLVTNGALPALTYTPTNGFTGVDSFTYTVNDGDDDSAPATVTVSVSADGITLPFEDLNTALLNENNTLNVGGIPSDVTGVVTNLDRVYSVSFTGADLDGDATNDEVTFDVRVKAWANGVTDLGFETVGQENVATNIASATIGTSNVAANVGNGNFTVAGNTMPNGSSLEFIIENLGVTLTDASKTGSAVSTGINSVQLSEINNGNRHQTIFGEGSGLLGWMWSTPDQRQVSGIDVGAGSLYVSSSATTNTAATRPFNWGVRDLDFGINITLGSAGVPDITIDVSGSDLVFTWEGGGTYNVLTNANLMNSGGWGVATNAASPITNAIGSDAQLFFKLD